MKESLGENPDKNEDKKIKPPPSLKEIENKGIEQEENEEDKKRELMFKLQLLQKQYPLRGYSRFYHTFRIQKYEENL